MKNFKDIEYVTLDFEGMKQRIQKLVDTINSTSAADEETFRRLDEEFIDFQKEAMHFLTIATAIYVANEFKKDKKKGADMFIKLCEVGNSMDYNDSIEYLGLKSAFDEEVIIAAAEYLKNELELD